MHSVRELFIFAENQESHHWSFTQRLRLPYNYNCDYHKFPNKGAGHRGKTLGGAIIRVGTFSPSSGIFSEWKSDNFWPKASRNPAGLRSKGGGGGASVGGGAFIGEFMVTTSVLDNSTPRSHSNCLFVSRRLYKQFIEVNRMMIVNGLIRSKVNENWIKYWF